MITVTDANHGDVFTCIADNTISSQRTLFLYVTIFAYEHRNQLTVFNSCNMKVSVVYLTVFINSYSYSYTPLVLCDFLADFSAQL